MGLIGEPLQRVADWGRGVGWIAVVLGGLTVIIAVIGGLARTSGEIPVMLVSVVLVGSVIPGVLLVVFSRKLDDGAHWAFYPITALSIVMLCQAVVLRFVCWLASLPSLILIGACINGASEMRDYHRARRRRRTARGFEPIVNAPMASVKPPPPAKTFRTPKSD